jgi:hypothetical protein
MRFLTRKKSKTRKSKTRKNKNRNIKERQFVKNLLEEFKNKNFYIKRTKIYGEHHFKNDYYLSLNNIDNYDEHIHLILHNYKKNKNNNYSFGYMFKKYNKSHTHYIHSEYVKINIDDNCKKLALNIIKQYNKFLLE